MNDRMFDQIKEAADYIVTHLNVKPKIGMVLGTGLSNIASEIEDEVIIRYAAIPWFSHSTVASHKGEMVFGRLGEKDVVILAGRFHYYEGYTMQQVTFPVRVLKELGVETILISNAA
ncbi:MAG TPA: purine-nucleoside phosphorylase, partial [Saprospiraceae bacterium]|nr:purine-nucleoside phosphorylase [Saprospiraceae bacterium]